jgi:hypothetical protein
MCTTRLNDGISRVHSFSVVTTARLHKSDFVFRFYVYGGTFDNPPGYLLSARGTVFGALCASGFFGFIGTTGVLSASVSGFMIWDGGLPFSGITHTCCWLFGGIVRYRLSSQQKVHRCDSVLEKGKSMRGDNSFYFFSIIYNLWNNSPPYIFDLIPNHSCPVVPYQVSSICGAILGKARVFPQPPLLEHFFIYPFLPL